MKIKESDIEKMTKAYFAGIREGLAIYAHLNGNVQYVGIYGKTLQQAIDDVNTAEVNCLENLEELKGAIK